MKWRRKKQKFMIAQQGKCWLCGGLMRVDVHTFHALYATWDHVLPKSKGGANHQDNLMLAHRKCNRERGNRTEVRAMPRFTVNCKVSL